MVPGQGTGGFGVTQSWAWFSSTTDSPCHLGTLCSLCLCSLHCVMEMMTPYLDFMEINVPSPNRDSIKKKCLSFSCMRRPKCYKYKLKPLSSIVQSINGHFYYYPLIKLLTIWAKIVHQDDLLQNSRQGPVDDTGDGPLYNGQSFMNMRMTLRDGSYGEYVFWRHL